MKSILTLKRFLACCTLSLGICLNASAQDTTKMMTNADMVKIFNAYVGGYFSEKVFIHHDKDSYMAGETMWMRAYRTDASTLSPYYYSGLMYIELRDPENVMKHRMMIIKTDSVFQATYKIPQEWPSGTYELVAYTNLMQNYDDAFYFRKPVYIYNSTDDKVVADVSYEIVEDRQKQVKATIKLLGNDGSAYREPMVEVTPYINGRKGETVMRNVNKDGELSFNFPFASDVSGLNIRFAGSKPISYEHYFKVPIFSDSIDVQFMPEGGHLLAGVMQQVGFKAVGSDGKGVSVKGEVKDSLGNLAGFFESQHLGMGRFAFQPKAGTSYVAEVKAADGRIFTVPLPPVAERGVAVSTALRGNVLMCRVQGTADFDYTGLNLAVYSRGRLINWTPLKGASAIQLDVQKLQEGIVYCFVVDNYGRVYSERIALINKDASPEVTVSGLQTSYSRRQRVDMELNVTYGENVPLPSELSVAVLDSRRALVKNDDNIVSYMLLTSDIKGKIEKPSYYFDKSIPLAERNAMADLLMMTQGWKRFNVDSIFYGKRPDMPFPVEQSQYIAGTVKPLWRKSMPSGQAVILGMNPAENFSISRAVIADSSGFFQASFSYPRGTTFIVQGSDDKGKSNVEVEIEKQNFARLSKNPLTGRSVYTPEKAFVDSAALFHKSQGVKYIYENGERILLLDAAEVVVRANGDAESEMYDRVASNQISGAKLEEDSYTSISDWLQAIGVEVREDVSSISIRNQPANVVIDGFPASAEELLRVSVIEVADIWVFKDPMAMNMVLMSDDDGMRGGIVLRTKTGMGAAAKARETTFYHQFEMLGYSKPEKFYVPKYDDGQNSGVSDDYRMTVHWDPNVQTDASGKAKVSFYLTDAPTEYTIVIQGMAGTQQMGLPIYKKLSIRSGN